MKPSPFEALIEALRNELENLRYEIDAPGSVQGEWWLDLSVGDWSSTVSWKPNRKFGVFTSEGAYGSKPDEIFSDPEKAAVRLLQLLTRHRLSQATSAFTLKDIRQLIGGSQDVLARRLGKDQAEISRLEKRRDAKMSTIDSYITSLGGKLVVQVVFDDFSGPLALEIPHPIAVKAPNKTPAKRLRKRASTPSRKAAHAA